MKNIILLLFITISLNSFSQDKIYLDSAWREIDSPEKAFYYRILEKDKRDKNKGKLIDYYMSGKIQSEAYYTDFKKGIKSGKFIMYYENGNIKRDMDYLDGKRNGKYLAYNENGKLTEEIDYVEDKIAGKYRTYYESGNLEKDIAYSDSKRNGQFLVYRKTGELKRVDNYVNGDFTNGKCLDLAGNDTTYYDYEVAAIFPGGRGELMKFLGNEMIYPENAIRNNLEGKVYLRFIIDVDGSVKNVKVTRGVNSEFDAEAVRAVRNMPRWTPGMIDGVPVKSYFDLPVNFKLQGKIKK